MDPLSGVLELLKPRHSFFGGFDAAGAWSIRFPRYDAIRCYAIAAGSCWLAAEGVAEPVRLDAGDCVLLPDGRPNVMASDLGLEPVDFKAAFPTPTDGRVKYLNGGGEVRGVGGFIELAAGSAGLLLGELPPVVHVREDSDRSALRWAVDRLALEMHEPRPGGAAAIQHLAHLLLVHALRAHLADGPRGDVGWFSALADPALAAAIGAMHDDPAHPWTLPELAGRAGMSRSTFALRFREAVGSSPIDYLTRWRMLLAGDRLADTDDSIAAIARSLGYESESAFGAAFKRVMGCSPRRHGRGRAAAPSPAP